VPKSESFFGRIRSAAKAFADSAARSLQEAQGSCCGCKCEREQKGGGEKACKCGGKKQKNEVDGAAVASVTAGAEERGCCSGSSCSC